MTARMEERLCSRNGCSRLKAWSGSLSIYVSLRVGVRVGVYVLEGAKVKDGDVYEVEK